MHRSELLFVHRVQQFHLALATLALALIAYRTDHNIAAFNGATNGVIVFFLNAFHPDKFPDDTMKKLAEERTKNLNIAACYRVLELPHGRVSLEFLLSRKIIGSRMVEMPLEGAGLALW
jgi:hypothetical protein